MKRIALALMAFIMMMATAACSSGGEEKGLAGTWVLDGATVNGTDYTAQELSDMASQLGEFGQLLDMKLLFKEDGTGEMVYEGLDLGDLDMTVSWEGEGDAFTMTDSTGSKTNITYDKEKDRISFLSNQSTMVFKRQD